jgi:4-diphosphocytidyl-2-C-methyl-D-erythritol kinase
MPLFSSTLKSHAKVNLYLDVTSKRGDGYHEINTLFAPIELHDTITLKMTENGIVISCDDEAVPTDETNLAYKAARLFFDETGILGGVDIDIKKSIPVAGGLGGGSSNAAVTLIGLNEMHKSPLTEEKLLALGKELGADVPFFIYSKPAYARGIGDIFVSYPTLPELHFLLVNPGFHVSSAFAYNDLKITDEKREIDLKERFSSLNSAEDVANILKNSLEEPVIKKYPMINDIKEELIRHNALGALMSGSGPTVFGIYKTHSEAAYAMEKITRLMPAFTVLITKNKS